MSTFRPNPWGVWRRGGSSWGVYSDLGAVLGGHRGCVRPLCAPAPVTRRLSRGLTPTSTTRPCRVLRAPGPTTGSGWDTGSPGSLLDAVPLSPGVWGLSDDCPGPGWCRPGLVGEEGGPERVSGKGPRVHRAQEGTEASSHDQWWPVFDTTSVEPETFRLKSPNPLVLGESERLEPGWEDRLAD